MRVDLETIARIGDGMRCQLARFEHARSEGMPRRGWKVGINVPEVQQQLGIAHAAVGWIDGRCVLDSNTIRPIPANARIHVEPELAVEVGEARRDGVPSVTCVYPALELVDYAYPTRGLTDLIEHSMFHCATVLGAAGTIDQARALGGSLPTLTIGSEPTMPPRSGLVPADPSELVAFVEASLAHFAMTLDPGDLLLCGSYVAQPPRLRAGIRATADFGPLGSVSIHTAAASA